MDGQRAGVAELDGDVLYLWAMLGAIAAGLWAMQNHVKQARREQRAERNARLQAEELVERRDTDVNGALEELHAAQERIAELEAAAAPPGGTQ